MNRLANLLGYRLANHAGSGSVSGPLSTPVGGPVSDSVPEPPHVRAIASRPVPARPFQTRTVPGGFSYLNKQISTAKEPFSIDGEVARRANVWAPTREAVAS